MKELKIPSCNLQNVINPLISEAKELRQTPMSTAERIRREETLLKKMDSVLQVGEPLKELVVQLEEECDNVRWHVTDLKEKLARIA